MGKFLLGLVVLIVGGFLLLSVGPQYAGEAATLTTASSGGQLYETKLWVVDEHGAVYVRASNPRSDWVVRLRGDAQVLLERNGNKARYRAEPLREDVFREIVNRLMAEKYGLWDRLDGYLLDHETSLPIRLHPLDD